MSFRGLVDGDCSGANPLVQLSEGVRRQTINPEQAFHSSAPLHQEQMVNEFLGQIAGPPQTFRMDSLLEQMREIEQHNLHPAVLNAPKIIQKVSTSGTAWEWANDIAQSSSNPLSSSTQQIDEISNHGLPMRQPYYHTPIHTNWNRGNFINVQPVQTNITYAQQFFDDNVKEEQKSVNNFFEEIDTDSKNLETVENINDEWLEDFKKNKEDEAEKTANYYDKFWSKLQKDWNDLAEYENHPWLAQEVDFDPYKEYDFIQNNPMVENSNAFEKGKELLAQGDIPSAVLCFEAAVQQQSNTENPYAWELLGLSQAENEMDPHAISALKKSLDLKPDNLRALMALAVSYTNESLQSQALNMLAKWLFYHPKYSHLVPPHLIPDDKQPITSSVIGSSALKEMQKTFIDVVQKYPETIDADVQEALGVLFNLSSEYDKAVDCFQTALYANPENSKTWNRLGASLANGNRSVEAVEAYKKALDLQPGFIRARYNVGIICMNLKSYKEAAEHLLTALNMQATSPNRTGLPEQLTNGANQMSEVIWSTLRMVFALMGRDDLKKAASNKDLEILNREMKL